MTTIHREESLPVKSNTSKLATLWEDKIQGNSEKGVHKANSVDVPDEIVVVKANSIIDPPTTTADTADTADTTDTTNTTNNANNATTVTTTDGIERKISSANMDVDGLKSNNSTRSMVETFERMASENMPDRATAMTTHGVALLPVVSNDITRRASNSTMSRRISSILEPNDKVEELTRRVESMSTRVAQLEKQFAVLEKKFVDSGAGAMDPIHDIPDVSTVVDVVDAVHVIDVVDAAAVATHAE